MMRGSDHEPGSEAAPIADIVHGGAIRLRINWIGADGAPAGLVGCSRYEVPPGARCTLHVHTGKTEYWVIVQGRAAVTVGDTTVEMTSGDAVKTPPGIPHGLVNTGTESVSFVNMFELHPDSPLSTTELEGA